VYWLKQRFKISSLTDASISTAGIYTNMLEWAADRYKAARPELLQALKYRTNAMMKLSGLIITIIIIIITTIILGHVIALQFLTILL
jgi:hypothetical protein